MRNIKIKIVLNRKNTQDTEGYLNLSVLIPGTKKYLKRSLNYKVQVHQWDKKNQIVINHHRASAINADIAQERRKLELEFEQGVMDGQTFTKTAITEKLRGKAGLKKLIPFYDEIIKQMETERKGRDGSRKKYSDSYIAKHKGYKAALDKYSPGISFADIDSKWLHDLEAHFSTKLNGDTSLPVFMSKVKGVLAQAAKYGYFDMQRIAQYDTPTYINPDREYLTIEEIGAIEKLIYGGKLKHATKALKVACFFVIECLAGIRFSDWSRFKIEKLNENEAIKVRAKKNNEPVYIPLHNSPKLKRICDYVRDNNIVFDLSESETNRILRETLSVMAEIKKHVTTHVGRHTCATLLLEKGYSYETISEWLGISVKTVMIYAKVTRRKLSNEYEKLGGL